MRRVSSRLRAALVLSVADVFFGAIGVLVIIIVFSAGRSESRIVEEFDARATCSGTNLGNLRLRPEGSGEATTVEDWLGAVPSDRFMLRYGIRPKGEDISCYYLIRQIALEHNQMLEQRGATQAVLSIEYWRTDEKAP